MPDGDWRIRLTKKNAPGLPGRKVDGVIESENHWRAGGLARPGRGLSRREGLRGLRLILLRIDRNAYRSHPPIGIRRGFLASGISRTRSTCNNPFSRLAPRTCTPSASWKRRSKERAAMP